MEKKTIVDGTFTCILILVSSVVQDEINGISQLGTKVQSNRITNVEVGIL